MRKAKWQDNPYPTKVPIELVGFEASFAPFIDKVTGQRASMQASNMWQALIVKGAEYPRYSSFIENQALRYAFDDSKRDGDVTVFKVIPKLGAIGTGVSDLKHSASRTVITIDSKNVASYFELADHACPGGKFGYINKMSKHAEHIVQGTPIYQEEELIYPPNHVDPRISGPSDEYKLMCMGVNANVAYMSMIQAAEDAIVISEDFRDKCEYDTVSKVRISLDIDEIPLDRYSSVDNNGLNKYKAFPDIGEKVNKDGVLMALRKFVPENFPALVSSSRGSILRGDDKVIYAPAGSTIKDITVYFGKKGLADATGGDPAMHQLLEYYRHHEAYHKAVVKTYTELQEMGVSRISPKFNDLVTRAIALQRPINKRLKKLELVDGKMTVDNCVIDITYVTTNRVGIGSKFAGKSGDKGVIGAIWPTEWMPRDENGFVADAIIPFDTVSNRLNTAQNYSQNINRLAELVHLRILDGQYGDGLELYDTAMAFISDVHAEYANLLKEQHPTPKLKLEFVNDVKAEGFYFVGMPFSVHSSIENMRILNDKWQYEKTQVTFKYDVGNRVKTFTSKQAITIGSKYMFLLGKIPKDQLMAHQLTHVNQFGLPIKTKNKSIKLQYATTPTPVRFGEDEIGLISMLQEDERTARFLMMRSSCRSAVELVATTQLTAKNPSDTGRIGMNTSSMLDSSETVKLMHHQLNVVGMDLSKKSKGYRRPKKKGK